MKSNLINNSLLKHPDQTSIPCYRKGICYSLHSYLNAGNDLNPEKIHEMKDKFEKWEHFSISDKSDKEKYFLKMYPSKNEDLYTIKIRNLEPLLLYKKSHSEFNGKPNKPRIEAFNYAIRNVIKNLDEIINIISKYVNKEWCHELEIELEKIFNYKKPTP